MRLPGDTKMASTCIEKSLVRIAVAPYQENRFEIRSLRVDFCYDFFVKNAIIIDVVSVLYGTS